MNREEIAPEPRPDAALPAGFDPQHAGAILCVVERDPVDQAAQDLRQASEARRRQAGVRIERTRLRERGVNLA
jgi:hypothetical protein